jgi:hypothetical protein
VPRPDDAAAGGRIKNQCVYIILFERGHNDDNPVEARKIYF